MYLRTYEYMSVNQIVNLCVGAYACAHAHGAHAHAYHINAHAHAHAHVHAHAHAHARTHPDTHARDKATQAEQATPTRVGAAMDSDISPYKGSCLTGSGGRLHEEVGAVGVLDDSRVLAPAFAFHARSSLAALRVLTHRQTQTQTQTQTHTYTHNHLHTSSS